MKLYFENIAPSWVSQFERDPIQYFDAWGVPYYYDSIMHYFPYVSGRPMRRLVEAPTSDVRL